MAKRRRFGRSITLPWERRGAWVRDLVRGRRWKLILAALAALALVLVVARAAEQRQRVRETRAAIAEVTVSYAPRPVRIVIDRLEDPGSKEGLTPRANAV